MFVNSGLSPQLSTDGVEVETGCTWLLGGGEEVAGGAGGVVVVGVGGGVDEAGGATRGAELAGGAGVGADEARGVGEGVEAGNGGAVVEAGGTGGGGGVEAAGGGRLDAGSDEVPDAGAGRGEIVITSGVVVASAGGGGIAVVLAALSGGLSGILGGTELLAGVGTEGIAEVVLASGADVGATAGIGGEVKAWVFEGSAGRDEVAIVAAPESAPVSQRGSPRASPWIIPVKDSSHSAKVVAETHRNWPA